MPRMMSACGVWCSDCPAYHARAKGVAHQRRTVEAWHRIYGLQVSIQDLACGGCLGPDEELFHMSRGCKARRCSRLKGYRTCAECPKTSCAVLEKAQALWDGVPALASKLSRADFAEYARPYCGHRRRLAAARATRTQPPRRGSLRGRGPK